MTKYPLTVVKDVQPIQVLHSDASSLFHFVSQLFLFSLVFSYFLIFWYTLHRRVWTLMLAYVLCLYHPQNCVSDKPVVLQTQCSTQNPAQSNSLSCYYYQLGCQPSAGTRALRAPQRSFGANPENFVTDKHTLRLL